MDQNELIAQLSLQIKNLEEVESLLLLYFEQSMFITGDLEQKFPGLRRARVLTGEYFNRHGWPKEDM